MEALRIASEQLKATSNRLLSTAFAGPYARWVALTHQGSADLTHPRSLLGGLVDNLEQYDAIDQVEILAAMRLLQSWENIADPMIGNQLSARLLALPQAVRSYLAYFAGTPSTI
jgi:hypothetical protein